MVHPVRSKRQSAWDNHNLHLYTEITGYWLNRYPTSVWTVQVRLHYFFMNNKPTLISHYSRDFVSLRYGNIFHRTRGADLLHVRAMLRWIDIFVATSFDRKWNPLEIQHVETNHGCDRRGRLQSGALTRVSSYGTHIHTCTTFYGGVSRANTHNTGFAFNMDFNYTIFHF